MDLCLQLNLNIQIQIESQLERVLLATVLLGLLHLLLLLHHLLLLLLLIQHLLLLVLAWYHLSPVLFVVHILHLALEGGPSPPARLGLGLSLLPLAAAAAAGLFALWLRRWCCRLVVILILVV